MLQVILNVFLLLPPLGACIWTAHSLTGVNALQRKIIVSVFVPLTLFYFVIQNLLVFVGHYPFAGAKFLHDLSATLLVPLAYLMIRQSLDVTSGSKVIYVLLAMLVLLVPDLCLLLTRPHGAPLPDVNSKYNYIQFNLTPTIHAKQSIYSLIIIMQICVVISRVLVMRRIFITRDLYLSDNGRRIVHSCLAGCVWIVISLLPSQQWLKDTGMMLGINVGYSILIMVIVLMIGKYLGKSIVVNKDNEPVDLEGDMDSDLAEGLQLAIERDKVYLNSSLRIEDMAMMLLTNRTYVTRVCRLKFGMTFTELMNHYRVEHSKKLLAGDARLRMEQVASESGFSSASFFAKVFKNHEGCTPTQWRMQQQKNGGGKSWINVFQDDDQYREVYDGRSRE